MINWKNVRFAQCRVCERDLGETRRLPEDHWAHEVNYDLCRKCLDRIERWVGRKALYEPVRLRKGKATYSIGSSKIVYRTTKADLEREARQGIIDVRDGDWPIPDTGHIYVWFNPKFLRNPNSLDVTEWVNMNLKRLARTAAASARLPRAASDPDA